MAKRGFRLRTVVNRRRMRAEAEVMTRHVCCVGSGVAAVHSCTVFRQTEKKIMLYTIAVVLLVLWLLGLVTSYTLGGFIHALLVIALVVFLIQLLSGRRVP